MFVGYVRCIASILEFSDYQARQTPPLRSSAKRCWMLALLVSVTACGKSGQSSNAGGAFSASAGAGGTGAVMASGGDATNQAGMPGAGATSSGGSAPTGQGGASAAGGANAGSAGVAVTSGAS